MVYDSADGYFVLYGGVDPLTDQYSPATWTFQGGTWQQHEFSPSPAPSDYGDMAYDPAIPGVVYWGGGGPFGYFNDTWLYAHGQWTQLCGQCGPHARWGMGLTYDPGSGALYGYGGCSAAPQNLSNGTCPWGDTWKLTFSGTSYNWTPVLSTKAPKQCFGAAFTYDPVLGGILLYGGYDNVLGSSSILSATWLLKGGQWTKLLPTILPKPSYFASMVYDPAAGGPILFGGISPTPGIPQVTANTYLFEQGNWTSVNTTLAPEARASAAYAYDNTSGILLLFGGSGTSSTYSSTWEFGPASGTPAPSGQGGSFFGIPLFSLAIASVIAIALVIGLALLLRLRGNHAHARRTLDAEGPGGPPVISTPRTPHLGGSSEPLRLKIKLAPLTLVEVHDPGEIWTALHDPSLEPSKMLLVTKTPGDAGGILSGAETWHLAFGEGEGKIQPGDLDRLGSVIETHLSKFPGCVVFVDGIDLISQSSSFKNARRFVQVTREIAEEHRAHALFRIPPGIYTPTELSQLEEGAQVIRL